MAKLANYFTKADRKKLFFDYLKLIGILEIVIFIVVVLWASDDKYHRVQSVFPWREYVFVAFAFPIVFTFLMGVIITGFNYFLGGETGYNTFRFLSYVLAGLGVIVVIYMLFFLFFKYRLNHKHMKYQYYSDISDKHGLIILDDRTVLHKNGHLLVKNRRWRGPKQVGKPSSQPELYSPDSSNQDRLPLPKP